ncbi:MAG: MFS transporter [Curtobacterium sp.]|jgi:MFS family permease
MSGGAASSRGRHPLVSRVWVLTAVVAMADFVFGATFVVFMQSRGLSATAIGTLLSLTAITSVLLEAPSGAWGDRHGHKRLVGAGLALWGAGLVVFSLAPGAAWFGVAIGMWASGLALYSGAAMSLLINTLNAAGREDHGDGAIRGTETIRWGAAAAGALVVAATAWVMSTQASIVLSGLLLLAAAAWVLVRWPDSPARHRDSVFGSLRAGTAFVLAPGCRLLLALSILTSVDLAVVILTWQPIALRVVGLETQLLGMALLVLSLTVAAVAFVSRWVPRRAVPAAVGAAVVLVNACLALASLGPSGAVAAVCGAEFFLGIALTLLAVWSQRRFPDRIRATATSLLGTATGVAIAATNAVMGCLWDDVGLQQAVVVAAVVVASLTTVTCTAALVARRGRLPRWTPCTQPTTSSPPSPQLPPAPSETAT